MCTIIGCMQDYLKWAEINDFFDIRKFFKNIETYAPSFTNFQILEYCAIFGSIDHQQSNDAESDFKASDMEHVEYNAAG